MNLPKSIILCEVGPRDGLQNEPKILSVEEKVALIDGIADAGFPVIEVGSFMHPKAVPQMANTDDVFRAITPRDGVEYRALIPNARGVSRAIDCGCKKVKLNVSASRAHNIANLNRTPEESVAGFKEACDLALENDIAISGSISMPFGSPWEHKIPVADVLSIIEAYIAVGITEISLSDASGMAVPSQVYDIAQLVTQKYPQVTFWLHFHNTRGLGIANILAGMLAGIQRFDTSFGGVGGCPFVPGAAGNVTSEDVVHMLDEMGIQTGIDIDKSIAVSKKIVDLLGHPTDSYILRAGKSSELIKEI